MRDEKDLMVDHLAYLHEKSGECTELFKGGQDSLKRFVYCAVEKLHKCTASLQVLYPLIYQNNEVEFGLGIVLRSLLMDTLLTQYLRYLTLTANRENHEIIKEEIDKYALLFIADGTALIIEDYRNFAQMSEEEKRVVAQRMADIFPGVFETGTDGYPKRKNEFRLSIQKLFKESDHELMYSRKLVYELYAYYSKYDHLSHWTSLLSNIQLGERIDKAGAAIAMILYNLRDLLVVSQFHSELSTLVPPLIADLDSYIRKMHPDLKEGEDNNTSSGTDAIL